MRSPELERWHGGCSQAEASSADSCVLPGARHLGSCIPAVRGTCCRTRCSLLWVAWDSYERAATLVSPGAKGVGDTWPGHGEDEASSTLERVQVLLGAIFHAPE